MMNKKDLFRPSLLEGGFTLIEMLAALVIILLLSASLLQVIGASTALWHSSITRSGNNQTVRNTYRLMERELKNTRVSLVTNNTLSQPQAFGFLSAYDGNQHFVTDATGRPQWQRYTIYYIPTGTDNLVRLEVYGNFVGAMTPQQLAAYCNGQGKTVARGVKSLVMETEPAENWVKITISSDLASSAGKTDRQQMDFTIKMRN